MRWEEVGRGQLRTPRRINTRLLQKETSRSLLTSGRGGEDGWKQDKPGSGDLTSLAPPPPGVPLGPCLRLVPGDQG